MSLSCIGPGERKQISEFKTFGDVAIQGYEEDPSGLKLLGHRWYDSATGRFLTRDLAQDGRNWYDYAGNNPLMDVDPSGLARILLIWYEVALGGHHAGILVIDNTHGSASAIWSFAGGHQHYGTLFSGHLISRSGPWKTRTQDNDRTGVKVGIGVVLVDDDTDAKVWIRRLHDIESGMKGSTTPRYDILGTGPQNGANSNSWAYYLLKRTNLLAAYDHATAKRGGAPWTPGWGNDVWSK